MFNRVIKGTKVIKERKNVIQGQRPDMEHRHTQERTLNIQNNTYKVTKVYKQLESHKKLGAWTGCIERVS